MSLCRHLFTYLNFFVFFFHLIFFVSFLVGFIPAKSLVVFFFSFFSLVRFASSGKGKAQVRGWRILSQAGLGNESCHARPERVKLQLELLTHMHDEKCYWSRKWEMMLILYVGNVSICTCMYHLHQFVGRREGLSYFILLSITNALSWEWRRRWRSTLFYYIHAV